MSEAPPVDVRERLDALRAVLDGCRRALVLTHDNPDPDALASAFGLAAVFVHLSDIDCEVGYAGLIGRAENRAMLRELDLAPLRIHGDTLERFDAIALVDTQPGFGNNSLPEDREATAVVDHHPAKDGLGNVPFVDIREGYGATATIVYEYARTAGAPLAANVLTALFYAIKSETQELGREAGDADRDAYLALLPEADKPAIARIQRASVPRNYFRAFQLAIENARLYGGTVITELPRVDSPDMVAEIADFLLRLEGADWAFCMGRYEDAAVMSLRTAEDDAHAGQVIRRVVSGHGRAGGHGTMAGGRVPLDGRDYEPLAATIRERLIDELSPGDTEGEPLAAP